jgi:uncharacterized paraquat-inducible protein A
MTKRELAIRQIELQERIKALANVNIVECNVCSAIIMHDRNDEEAECFSCGEKVYFNDCQDYWYEGLEDSAEFNED